MKNRFKELSSVSIKYYKDNNHCGLIAACVATGAKYGKVFNNLKRQGRKLGTSSGYDGLERVIRELGYTLPDCEGHLGGTLRCGKYLQRNGSLFAELCFQRIYGVKHSRAKTVCSLGKRPPQGTYLVFTAKHVLTLRDGVVHDWTEGRRNRIKAIIKVEKV